MDAKCNPHDVSRGLRKSMPIEYSRSGRHRQRGKHQPLLVQYDGLGNYKERRVSVAISPCLAMLALGLFVGAVFL